jgi:hypothetical protein
MRPVQSLPLALVCALGLAACGGGHSKSSSSAAQTTTPAAAQATTATSQSATAAPAASSPARCAPSQLRLTVVSHQGATGHLAAVFAFTNSSSTPCHLFGYPGAQMVSSAGGALKTVVIRGGGFFPDSARRPSTVVIQPGSSARFSFEWTDANEFGGSPASCPRADRLHVTPPNDYSTISVSVGRFDFAPCGGRITASPVFP